MLRLCLAALPLVAACAVEDVGELGPDGGLEDLAGLACDPTTRATFRWPLNGSSGSAWVINNYVDDDPATGAVRDYTGATGSAAKTYDNHKGVDIDVPSFRAMDAGFPVLAIAPGVVEYVQDGYFDRNVTCASYDANLIRIRHDDCSRVLFVHLKRGSIRVDPGQRVAEGQTLAVVGSSGCSTQPHLHVELRDKDNHTEDPFRTGRWRSPPAYSPPLSIMEVAMRSGSFTSIAQVKDPVPNPTHFAPGSGIGIAANAAGGKAGNTLSMRILRPDGSVYTTGSVTFASTYRHSYWWWNRTVGGAVGTWRVELRANGGTPKVRYFAVP